MTNMRRLEGELTIDHRASPGTAEVPAGTLFEGPTFTCCHCNRVVVKNAQRQRPRNVCHKCMKWTCDYGVCVTECNPIVQSVDLALRYAETGQSFLLRGPNGEVLFDKRLVDKDTVY